MRHNYKLSAEPSLVQGVANQLRRADTVYVRFTGEFGVYVSAESPHAVLDALIPMEGWTLRDVKECV